MDHGFVPVEGGGLYYEAVGEGHPIVLIHAGFVDRRMWDPQLELLARDHRVIRYDVRGFGKSDRPTSPFSDTRDLLALMDQLGINGAYLVGVSNGGRIALDFVLEHPSRVDGLVLVGPGVDGYQTSGPEEDKVWAAQEEKEGLIEAMAREGRISDAAAMDVAMWASAQEPAEREKVLIMAMDNAHIHSDPPGRHRVPAARKAFQCLADIRIPTLIVAGDRDIPGMKYIAEALHKRIKGSTKVVLRGADHLPNLSRPLEFNRALLRFFAGLEEGPRGQI